MKADRYADALRLIPARAGRTRSVWVGIFGQGAHPRSRGAHAATQRPQAVVEGSSPLARGARGTSRPSRASGPAHPRSRGAHVVLVEAAAVARGSSPLARGAPVLGVPYVRRRGLIPARAGRTSALSPSPLCRRAHPRSRGAHCRPRWGCSGRPGSSPLARGAHSPRIVVDPDPGLIPARAGRTACGHGRAAPRRAHPRSRGAHAAS